MAKFNWHADFFDGLDSGLGSVRTVILKADNADEAERIARAQMGFCKRVEVRRAATAAPVRVIYGSKERGDKTHSADIFSLARAMFRAPVAS
jgi:hypothetical protein